MLNFKDLKLTDVRPCSYARISVDTDEARDENASIENQKLINSNFIKKNFPNSKFDMEKDTFTDRDRSGWTFSQRTGYQQMKALCLAGVYNVIVVKDLTRFGRRTSQGASELEELLRAGIHIVMSSDNSEIEELDLITVVKLALAENAVTEASKKVRRVIKEKQEAGTWVTNAPYGYYLTGYKNQTLNIDEEGKKAVQKIFELYSKGYGYKAIAHYLTEHEYPTGRALMLKHMIEREADTEKFLKTPINPVWSVVSVQKIVTNDFYIGTFTTGVWSRNEIHGTEKRTDPSTHNKFPDHHEAMISKELFEKVQKLNRKASKGQAAKTQKKYKNTYTGFLFCADCGQPLFGTSNGKKFMGYICSNYMKNGIKGSNAERLQKKWMKQENSDIHVLNAKERKVDYSHELLGCTGSHRIHEHELNAVIKSYLTVARDRLASALGNLDLAKSQERIYKNNLEIADLQKQIAESQETLKLIAKQRLQELLKKPDMEDIVNQKFDDIESEYYQEIATCKARIKALSDEAETRKELKSNLSSVIATFNRLIDKDEFTKEDLAKIVERIEVGKHKELEVTLCANIDMMFDLTN